MTAIERLQIRLENNDGKTFTSYKGREISRPTEIINGAVRVLVGKRWHHAWIDEPRLDRVIVTQF